MWDLKRMSECRDRASLEGTDSPNSAEFNINFVIFYKRNLFKIYKLLI